jgi:hypothetical protein
MKIKGFSNSELAHLWANKVQAEGSGSNMYFEGDTIYSYGRHFPIARHYKDSVVFTTASYSNTTAKHMSHVRNACRHLPVVFVHDINANVERNAEAAEGAVVGLLKKASTARRNANHYVAQAFSIVDNLKDYHELLNGETVPMCEKLQKLVDMVTVPDMESFRRIQKAERAEYRRKIKERAARLAEAQKTNISRWLSGEVNYFPNAYDLPVALRLKKGMVETSKGAKVSIESAKVLLSLIERGRDIKGHVIDGYTVLSLNGVLKIGCHNIPLTEVKRIKELIYSL